jgi:LuxR family glucitol operon transcriptional activator
VAQLARGYGLTEALERLHRLEGDFGHYHFAPLFRSLQGQAAYYLILALALFPQPATKGAIAHTALLDVTACGDGFATLYQHSWVTWQRQDDRYALLPLVRTYALGELQTYPEFAQEARHHQLNWYLEHLAQAPPQSWLAAEQETLQALLRWCESQNYQDQCQRLKPHILKNF